MKFLNNDKPLIFVGDIHGDFRSLLLNLDSKNIENANIFSVGDIGIGFQFSSESELKLIKTVNSFLSEKNINFYGIRGNHDNPSFFKDEKRINLSNFELLEDYSILSYKNKTIQAIGGAISIDRTARKEGVSYWENEGLTFDRDKIQKADILVTHTAPSWCFPQSFNNIVYGWAGEDAYLIEDLNEERGLIDEIFKLCQPSFHIYGHFHSSWTEEINGCKHKLLDIDELFEYHI